jgi:hypothetical protein
LKKANLAEKEKADFKKWEAKTLAVSVEDTMTAVYDVMDNLLGPPCK